MSNKPKKIFVATSGGVDSSMAAAILIREGFECAGVFMITHADAQKAQASAEQVAGQLGIKLHVLDLRRDFERIIEYFCNEYKAGRTPNPCVMCNRTIKFGKLWEFAKSNGAQLFATGHYAQVLPGQTGPGLFTADDETKDQSYALAMINKEMLNHIILPLGQYTKTQTRRLAKEMGLVTAEGKESQEICFIPGNDYVSFLEKRCPEIARKGKITNSSGQTLGEHNGIHNFTIGQRRGVRVAMGEPWYVIKLDATDNTVILGPKSEVMHKSLVAGNINWLIDKPREAFEAGVKIRYNAKCVDATVIPEHNKVHIKFAEPVAAITPGQLAVFYTQEQNRRQVVGGGWIETTTP